MKTLEITTFYIKFQNEDDNSIGYMYYAKSPFNDDYAKVSYVTPAISSLYKEVDGILLDEYFDYKWINQEKEFYKREEEEYKFLT